MTHPTGSAPPSQSRRALIQQAMPRREQGDTLHGGKLIGNPSVVWEERRKGCWQEPTPMSDA